MIEFKFLKFWEYQCKSCGKIVKDPEKHISKCEVGDYEILRRKQSGL